MVGFVFSKEEKFEICPSGKSISVQLDCLSSSLWAFPGCSRTCLDLARDTHAPASPRTGTAPLSSARTRSQTLHRVPPPLTRYFIQKVGSPALLRVPYLWEQTGT